MSAIRCPAYRCDARMDPDTDGNGGIVFRCVPCSRVAAGICVDCPTRIKKGRRRCNACQVRAIKAREKRRLAGRRTKIRVWARWYRSTPEGHAASLRAEKKYRDSHPLTPMDRKIRAIRARQRRETKRSRAA